MVIAAATCRFNTFKSTTNSRHSISSHRLFSTSQPHSLLFPSNSTNQIHTRRYTIHKELPLSPPKSSFQKEAKSQKFSGRSKGVRHGLDVDGRSKGDTVRSRSTARSVVRKGAKASVVDSINQQVKSATQDTAPALLNSVVKVYCTHTEPDYTLPWQKQKRFTSTGSAFMIGDRKLLTNAHCVEHNTQIKVKRRGDDTKYVAKLPSVRAILDAILLMGHPETASLCNAGVRLRTSDPPYFTVGGSLYDTGVMLLLLYWHQLARHPPPPNFVLAIGMDCDIALLSVECEEFWTGTWPLKLGQLPSLQDEVTVVGYPLGGDTISVTKGIVSRIEVTSYGFAELLAIQIDAAVNPGNSGGPAFNDQGECIGVAFQVLASEEAENIGYMIPTTVVAHFLDDYKRNGKYTGFPSLGILFQRLENPTLRAYLKSNEGVLVRRVEPTSGAVNILKEGDVIVSFDGVEIGSEGTVPFGSTERIAFRHLISQKFTGDEAELGIIREGASMKIKVVVKPRIQMVPDYIEERNPSYLVVAGLVFTVLSEPLIDKERDENIGLRLLTKARYSLPKFNGEEIVIVSQVLANEVNTGYEDLTNEQVLKLNGVRIKNIHHLAHLVDKCKDKYLVFEFEDDYLAVLARKKSAKALPDLLKYHGIPSERSADLLKKYKDPLGDDKAKDEYNFGDGPVSNKEIEIEDLFWV